MPPEFAKMICFGFVMDQDCFDLAEQVCIGSAEVAEPSKKKGDSDYPKLKLQDLFEGVR